MPADIAPAVVADLKSGLKFSKFVPHKDIAESEVTGQQELTFKVRSVSGKTAFPGQQHRERRRCEIL